MPSSRPLAIALGVFAAALAATASCSKKEPATITFGVSSELLPGKGIDHLDVLVGRGTGSSYNTKVSFDVDLNAYENGLLPLAIPVEVAAGDDLGTPAHVQVVGTRGGFLRVERKAQVDFVEGRSKLVLVPLRYACDEVVCNAPATTCVAGQCVSETEAAGTPVDYDLTRVYGFYGDGNCFDEGLTGCFASPQAIDVAALAASPDCSLPVVAAPAAAPPACPGSGGTTGFGGSSGLGGSIGIGGSVGVAGSAGTALTMGKPSDPDHFNVAVHFTGADTEDIARVVPLDLDPVEGWTFTDATKTRFRLAPRLCTLLHKQIITRVQVSYACPAKRPDQPVCNVPPSDAGVHTVLGAGDTPPGGESSCHLFARAYCKVARHCIASFSAQNGSGIDCVRNVENDCVRRQASPGANASLWDSCTEGIGASTCASYLANDWRTSCDIKGSLAVGTACLFNEQCASGYCPQDKTSCGVCTARAGIGQACTTDDGCGPTGACDGSKGVCVPRAQVGSFCDLDGGGDTCPGTSLRCIGSMCQVPHHKLYDPCGPTTGYDCSSVDIDLGCVIPDGGTTGYCQPETRYPGLGEPCGKYSPSGSYECQYRTSCDQSVCGGALGTCIPRQPLGQHCGPRDGGGYAACLEELDCNDAGLCQPWAPPTCMPKDAGPG